MNGNLVENVKTCRKCGQTKELSEFGKLANSDDGLNPWCKTCKSEAVAAWRAKNPEKVRASRDSVYTANKEKILARAAAWRANNPEAERRYVKAKNAKNAENPAKNRTLVAKWRKDNPEKVREYASKWAKENPQKIRILKQNRLARKRASGGRLSANLVEDLFKFQNGKCPCCQQPLGNDYHLDHIHPLALGGSNSDENMQLLRARCNLQKGAKHPVDFMQSRGFLL